MAALQDQGPRGPEDRSATLCRDTNSHGLPADVLGVDAMGEVWPFL